MSAVAGPAIIKELPRLKDLPRLCSRNGWRALEEVLGRNVLALAYKPQPAIRLSRSD